jgi:hypothetical protein
MTPPTLAFAALLILFIAAVALCGLLYLLLTEQRTKSQPDPEPPEWVNHHTGTRRRCPR